jgi:hypothetical protein
VWWRGTPVIVIARNHISVGSKPARAFSGSVLGTTTRPGANPTIAKSHNAANNCLLRFQRNKMSLKNSLAFYKTNVVGVVVVVNSANIGSVSCKALFVPF